MQTNKTMENMGLKTVRTWTYPGTYAVIEASSMMTQQLTNRDSTSWKKAEHVVVDEYQADGGVTLAKKWCEFLSSRPDDDLVDQKLYINIGNGQYALLNVNCQRVGTGTLAELIRPH